MKKIKQKLVIIFALVLVSINGISFGSAWGFYPTNPIPVDPIEITYANYLELDGDGYEDDVITQFTLKSPTGYYAYLDVELELELVLPSGYTYIMRFSITEFYVELPVTVEWHNCATESGWYDFNIEADIFGFDSDIIFSGIVTDSLTFDPPFDKSGSSIFGMVRY
ncbi:hypothetical protein NEF87_002510 [Candidatus Lokiarchaeum ossiferum]|uniref:DNRLRE domain-containing protein n=1 Tax=Candidatus Lokiarchaeum ossiferum TaxID=2951803 RepID=A0ABY6HRU2_9ARCH|nr:hypothetical protein NEF87_002510 [Candidatus Lokiarchaeum sp. B-35]